MIQFIKKLGKTGSRKQVDTAHAPAKFRLVYGKLDIGLLLWDGQTWCFEYSEVFKSQSEFAPLIDFPDVNKVYASQKLWPFFMHRIPSSARPEVRKEMTKQGLDDSNLVGMLSFFGERTISNPYRLLLSR